MTAINDRWFRDHQGELLWIARFHPAFFGFDSGGRGRGFPPHALTTASSRRDRFPGGRRVSTTDSYTRPVFARAVCSQWDELARLAREYRREAGWRARIMEQLRRRGPELVGGSAAVIGSLVLGAGVAPLFGTVTDCYTDPWPSNDNCTDGWVGLTGVVSWSATRDAPTGDWSNFTDHYTNVGVQWWYSIPQFIFKRAFYLFDSTSISPLDTVESAVFHHYNTSSRPDAYHMVQGNPLVNTVIQNADYSRTGSTSFGLMTTAGFGLQTSALNATGVAFVQTAVEGSIITKLALRYWRDLDDADPGSGDDTQQGMGFYTAEASGTANDPFLRVTHASSFTPRGPGGGVTDFAPSGNI